VGLREHGTEGTGSGKRRGGLGLPGCSCQQGIDHSRVQCGVLQLLEERWLMEGDASREGLGDDSLAFLHELGSQPVRRGGEAGLAGGNPWPN